MGLGRWKEKPPREAADGGALEQMVLPAVVPPGGRLQSSRLCQVFSSRAQPGARRLVPWELPLGLCSSCSRT